MMCVSPLFFVFIPEGLTISSSKPNRPTHVPTPHPGVQSFDVNLETQKVTVVGTATLAQVMDTIAKTGKAVEIWSD
jgi:hypothetical protein|tara:strand:+ start:721 stop:948 length:228 start_codon:yes stop_codon:yes gene_type:complete